MDSDVIQELFRYRNDSLTYFIPVSEQQMSMSDFADIMIDVNAHLCKPFDIDYHFYRHNYAAERAIFLFKYSTDTSC